MGNIKAKVATVVAGYTFLWFAMFIALVGVIFLAWGIYMILAATTLSPGLAAVIVGGSLLGLVVIVALIGVIAQSARKPGNTGAKRAGPDNAIEQQLRPVIGDRATNWAKQNTGIAVVGALSAGVLLAASPRLRSLIVSATGPIATRKAIEAVQRFSGQ